MVTEMATEMEVEMEMEMEMGKRFYGMLPHAKFELSDIG